MAKRLLFVVALFVFSFNLFTSCSTDFQVNAPYKEQYVVYGLLDLHSFTQIIKISKVFQNGNGVSAYQAAKQEDSLYANADLAIQLVELDNNGLIKNTTPLTRYADNHKDTGIFAAPNQYLYSTPAGFLLNSSSNYKLTIDNTKTKIHISAGTILVTDAVVTRPNSNSQIAFVTTGAYYPISFLPGGNATSYDLDIRIPIAEYRKKDSILLRRDTVVMNVMKNYLVNGKKVDYAINGKDFFLYLGAVLKADPAIYRKLGLLDFDFVGAGADLTNYISVNTPSLGIVQKKPDYSNVTGGVGIFSSRIHNHVNAALSDDGFAALVSSDATAALNFRK